jgi:hypothetical protein
VGSFNSREKAQKAQKGRTADKQMCFTARPQRKSPNNVVSSITFHRLSFVPLREIFSLAFLAPFEPFCGY